MDTDVEADPCETAPGDESLETPAYVYDLVALRRAHRQLTGSLPEPADLLYSLKANPHPAILRQLAGLGVRAEVSSPGELAAAVAAGFAPAGIFYTGPGKRDADVSRAIRLGVRRFSVDSPFGLDQLDRLARAADARVSALVRLNPPVPPAGAGLAMTGGPTQFGVDLAWLLDQPELFVGRENAQVDGVHLYMGSNLHQETALLAMFRYGLEVVGQVEKALDRRLPVVDLGGGFGAPYAADGQLPRFDSLKERLTALLREGLPGWSEGQRQIVFESGRYLTATCGRFLTRVLDVKRSQGRRIVVLDAGVNHLGGMSGLYKEARVEPRLRVSGKPAQYPDQQDPDPAVVAGPLCHPLDLWTRRGSLPEVAPGDLVTVPNVGAYGLHLGLALFHCHPLPLEVVVDEGREVERSRVVVGREPLP